MDKKEQVLDQLSEIIDPDLGKDIVSLGFIKELRISETDLVSFKIELTTPACPIKDQFRSQAELLVKKLPWVADVNVDMTAQNRPASRTDQDNLKGVRSIVAVSSCKGGVGKSTVAVNLAYTLAESGAKVGIFDADVYGPSLDILVKLPPEALGLKKNNIIPKQFHNVKLMSFAYTQNPYESAPAIMRGPMVTQVINQLLLGTNWGELDYLILDLPPGTGDIQITLAQVVSISAAVIVTTPQELSFVDVVKGIEMFDSLKIPTVGVVENMSYFICDGCDKQHRPFGAGAKRMLERQFGFENTIELPIDSDLTIACEEGVPFVLAYPDSELTRGFQAVVDHTVRQVAKVQHQGVQKPNVTYDPNRGVVIQNAEDEVVMSPYQLRLNCQCAHCVDEFTRDKIIREAEIQDDVRPVDIQNVGNYAVGISWSDDHHSLYPIQILTQ